MPKQYVYTKDLYALITKNAKTNLSEIKICLKNRNNFFLLSNGKSLLDNESAEERQEIIKTVDGYNKAGVCNHTHKISGNLVKLTHEPSFTTICFNLIPPVLKEKTIKDYLRTFQRNTQYANVISITDALKLEKEINLQIKAKVIKTKKEEALKQNIAETYKQFTEKNI